jgi:predicted metalloprotease with PDZ domain
MKFATLLAVLIACAAGAVFAPAARADTAPIQLYVNLRDAPSRVVHVFENIVAGPGGIDLVYPKWIPGEHSPSGSIDDLVNLRFDVSRGSDALETVPWRRDSLDMNEFHVETPPGTQALLVVFDLVSSGAETIGSSAASYTSQLGVLSWNQVVLLPKGAPSADVRITPRITLPEGWTFATALPVTEPATTHHDVTFATVSAERLVDSPIACGRHVRTLDLAPEVAPRHRIALVGDSEDALAAPAPLVHAWEQLVREARALTGASHYASYTFLLVLSDKIAQFGLEHHESSENRVEERMLVDDDLRRANASLLSHEFFHSWNGKHRRPEGLARPDFDAPESTELLWVYEGLTEYYGWVLAARSGLFTREEALDDLARTAAVQTGRSGRSWRSIEDTAIAAQLLYYAPPAFQDRRRDTDFYDSGLLLWLDVDVKIRELTGGRRSLDDFVRAFHGGTDDRVPTIVPFTIEDVVAALNRVAPFDWASYLGDRVGLHGTAGTLTNGIERAGFKLADRDTAPALYGSYDAAAERIDARFSLGFRVTDKGEILDVLANSPAGAAKLPPGATLVAVNGRRFTKDALADAIAATRPTPAADTPTRPAGRDHVELLVTDGDFYRTFVLRYAGGPRFPVLTRASGALDLLATILAPRAPRTPR